MPRRTPRLPTDLNAAVQARPDGPHILARVRDVSASGLRLERVGRPMREDEPVWIEIPRATHLGRVGLLGRIAWTAADRAGVVIEAMLPHHRERLSILLQELA